MEAKAKDCDTYDGGTGRRVEKKKGASRAVGATRHSWRTHPTVTENGQRTKSKVPTRSMLLVKRYAMSFLHLCY